MPQISADISDVTKEMLEKYSQDNGVKKAWLIDNALQHHLRALNELPADVIIPARFVPSREAAQRLVQGLNEAPEPTAELVELMRRGA